MSYSRIGLFASALAVLALAGCQSERFSRLDTRGPAPLAAAPTGPVQTGQLPPPVQPGTTDPSQFPPAPGQEDGPSLFTIGDNGGAAEGQETQMAALPPSDAPAVTAGSVAGVWSASVAGQSCRVATPQTRFGEGYRAGPLRCPAPLDSVRSWNVSGSQLVLYDEDGSALARLYSSGGERFEGQTSTGQSVSLSR